MKFKRGVRKRVFYVFSCFSVLLTLFYFMASLLLAYVVEDNVIERILEKEVLRIERHYFEHEELLQPTHSYISIYLTLEDAPASISQSNFKPSKFQSRQFQELFSEDGDTHYHVRTLFLDDDVTPIFVAEVSELLAVRSTANNWVVLFALTFFVSMSVAVVLTYYIAGFTTKPVIHLAEKLLTDSSPSQSVHLSRNSNAEDGRAYGDEFSGSEVDFLAGVIDQALSQLQEALQREADFNRDVSHELRTPLTIINNTLALKHSGELDQDEKDQIDRAAREMKRIVDALLILARKESTEQAEFSMLALSEEVVVELYPEIESKSFSLIINLNDFKVLGSRALVKLVIRNLIENALMHSSDTQMTIQCDGDAVCFTNTLVSTLDFNPVDPQAKHEKSVGLGQGLYLCKRILDRLNWPYQVSTHGDQFQFTITPRRAAI